MPTLIELTAQIVTAQASIAEMSTEHIVSALTRIHQTLGYLENGVQPKVLETDAEQNSSVAEKSVTCLICGKSFQTLGTHLRVAHNLSSNDYREKFGLPPYQPLMTLDSYRQRQTRLIRKSPPVAAEKETPTVSVSTPEAPKTTVLAKKRGRPRKSVVMQNL